MPAEPRRSDLERLGPAVGAQRNGLRIGDQLTRRQRQGGVDHVGERSVTSSRLRVNSRTSPLRWTCTRAPSSGLENRGAAELFERFADPAGGLASIGPTGVPTRSRKLRARRRRGSVPPPRRTADLRRALPRAGCPRPGSPRRGPLRRPSLRPVRPGAAHRRAVGAGTSARRRWPSRTAWKAVRPGGSEIQVRRTPRSRSGGGINTGHRQHRRIGGCGRARSAAHPTRSGVGEFAGQPGDGDRDLVRIVGRLRQ